MRPDSRSIADTANPPPKEDESLIKEPYLDSLVKINEDGIKKARTERKIRRDWIRIGLYFQQKFPHAKADVSSIPPKEFPVVARKARNYYLIRTVNASLWSLASIGGILRGLAYITQAWSFELIAVGLFFGGLGVMILAAVSLIFAIKKINKFAKILSGKYPYYSWTGR